MFFNFCHIYIVIFIYIYVFGIYHRISNTWFSGNADTGLVRPVGMAPFQRRLEGDGGIDANLPGHLEHLTAHVVGTRMNEIPIGWQAYTVGVS